MVEDTLPLALGRGAIKNATNVLHMRWVTLGSVTSYLVFSMPFKFSVHVICIVIEI